MIADVADEWPAGVLASVGGYGPVLCLRGHFFARTAGCVKVKRARTAHGEQSEEG